MDSNLAKLQRNRASCFLQLKQLEKVSSLEQQSGRQICRPMTAEGSACLNLQGDLSISQATMISAHAMFLQFICVMYWCMKTCLSGQRSS